MAIRHNDIQNLDILKVSEFLKSPLVMSLVEAVGEVVSLGLDVSPDRWVSGCLFVSLFIDLFRFSLSCYCIQSEH